MIDILKILLILILIIILLKRRWNIGAVMIISSIILALSYRIGFQNFGTAFIKASTDITSLNLIIVLYLIRVFENIMRKRGIMKEMMDSFRGMFINRKVLMASMPALIGLLPSMGGALFSAPMVDEASSGTKISPEKKAFINYLFRHPWEFILPLYPGLLLASAITAYPIRDLILLNLPYALCLIAGGVIWGLAGINREKEGIRSVTVKGLLSFLPLFLIIIMVMGFHINLTISMGAVVLGLLLILRYTPGNTLKTLHKSISVEIITIILGVMTFKAVLEQSGAVTNISSFLSETGIPILPVLFIIPFISGLLTGLTIGFVGSTFPIILGLEGAQNLSAISFAFASGYVGVLLSPVHLCLILTKEYFKAALPEIYINIVKVGILIMVAALAEYYILNS
jgi:integral membrane protein (TIGR00529 family)